MPRAHGGVTWRTQEETCEHTDVRLRVSPISKSITCSVSPLLRFHRLTLQNEQARDGVGGRRRQHAAAGQAGAQRCGGRGVGAGERARPPLVFDDIIRLDKEKLVVILAAIEEVHPGAAAAAAAAVEAAEAAAAAAAAVAVAAEQQPPRLACKKALCGADFAVPDALQEHIDAEHIIVAAHCAVKPHACSQCVAAFVKPSHLKDHVYSVHLGLKLHACSQCEVAFSTTSYLKRHVFEVHLGLKIAYLQPVRNNIQGERLPSV